MQCLPVVCLIQTSVDIHFKEGARVFSLTLRGANDWLKSSLVLFKDHVTDHLCNNQHVNLRGNRSSLVPSCSKLMWRECQQLSSDASLSLLLSDLRRPGVDPGGVHAGGAGEPSGLGHVRLCLLLCHDLHLDGGVRLRGASQQGHLGGRSKSGYLQLLIATQLQDLRNFTSALSSANGLGGSAP